MRANGFAICVCLAAGFAAAAEPVRVGLAERDITPTAAHGTIYLAGFGHNRKMADVLDPIAVRAAAFEHDGRKIAFACADVVGLFHPVAERIRARLPEFAAITVSCTHNHHGPDTMGLWGTSPLASGLNAKYSEYVEDQIVACIRAAEAKLQPIDARIGTLAAPDLLHDSRPPLVKHDTLAVIAFSPVGQTAPCGLLVQWNCHPETLDGKNARLSSDYVGTTVRALREKYHCPVLYLTGTVGGLMTTMHVDVHDRAGKLLPEGSPEKTARYGELLAERCGEALKVAQPVSLAPFDCRNRTIYLPVENSLYKLAGTLKVLERPMFEWTGNPAAKNPASVGPSHANPALKTEVGYWQLGEVGFALIPGEIYPELVLSRVQNPADPAADFPDAPIEPGIYAQMPSKYKLIVGLANDEIGYILPKRQWDQKPPYTYGLKKPPYGEINSLGPDTAPHLAEAFRSLVNRPQ